ncbi:MAG: hypothetical protein QOJ19_3190, partial [Acidimicrobiia bacterium]|nr:hypothetical protein [Acidimicrobiia bacterium]
EIARRLIRLQEDHLARLQQPFDPFEAQPDAPLITAELVRDLDIIRSELAAISEHERDEVIETVSLVQDTDDRLLAASRIGLAVKLALLGVCAAVIAANRRANERDRRHSEAALRRSEGRFRSLVENSADITLVLDAAGGLSYVSPACERVLGYDAESLGSIPLDELFHPDDLVRMLAARNHCAAEPGLTVGPVQARLRHSDGGWRWLEISLSNRLEDPDIVGFVANAHDITPVKLAEAELAHNATHDVLTGLPNRALLVDRLDQALARHSDNHDHQETLAVMFCDLDGFKVLNDSRGHRVGDTVLQEVSQRLLNAVRAHDTVARFGGDEFVICCEGLADHEEALMVAERLRQAVAPAYPIKNGEAFLTASIGLRIAANRGDSAEDIIRDADAAMYQAKANGRDGVVVYSEILRQQSEARLNLESGLRRALDRDELRVFYQPIVSVTSEELIGMEALLRWEHPSRGLVHPAEFIGVAEDTGLVEPIGAWVLEQACRQLKVWQERGLSPVHVAVNLSGRQLQSATIVDTVADILRRTAVNPADVCLEVTESVLMTDPAAAAAKLTRLRQLGVHLAIDDFGTGYSSLAQLRRFPIDRLKIDRSFVAHLGEEPESTAIVTAVLHLAKALGLTTVAEGVETAEQRAQLQLLGCELGQGYHWSRPAEADHLEAWLSTRPLEGAPPPADDLADGPRTFSVLIVDNDPAQRAMASHVLAGSPQFVVAGEASDGQAALEEVERCRPDLLLIDLAMPNLSGLQALPNILHRSPGTKVVLLSSHRFDDDDLAHLDAGPVTSAAADAELKAQDLLEELLTVVGADAALSA